MFRITFPNCQYCQKPIKICRQQDENFNRPVRYSVEPKYDKVDIPIQRYERAVRRLLGLYSKKEDTYYDYPEDDLDNYEYYEKMAMLPLCVFENGNKDYFIDCKMTLSMWHIFKLGIEEEYKVILKDLSDQEIKHNFN